MQYIVGADPGRHGAVVVLNAADGSIVKMIPTKMIKDSDVFDHTWMRSQLTEFYGKCAAVWMEEVHAIFGSSAGATFAFGDANGALRVTLEMSLIQPGSAARVYTVQPKQWQKVAWRNIEVVASPKIVAGAPVLLKSGKPKMIVDTKATSLRAAQALFQDETFIMPRCRKPHDGVVDAALIAYYGLVKQPD